MNYKRLYFTIIRNRINNPLPSEEYGEVHHIKPRSFWNLSQQNNNPDDQNNLVRLSAREHFIVHFLLYKIYKHRSENIFPKSKRELERYKKMTLAFNMMINAKSKLHKRLDKNINNRVFAQLRQEVSKLSKQQIKYPFELIKQMFDFYVINKLTPNTINILNKQFNNKITYTALQKLFYRHNLKLTQHQSYDATTKNKKHDAETVKQMFDFYVLNKLTSENMDLLNEKFNTNLSYNALKKMFYRNGLKLTSHESYKTKVILSKAKVKDMFKFYVNNNLTSKNIELLNKEFNVDFNYAKLIKLFNKNNLKLTEQKTYVSPVKQYSRQEIQDMFMFYVKNALTPKTVYVLNEKFNMDFNYNRLKALFNRHGFKIVQLRRQYASTTVRQLAS
nr:MAG TPA: HNH endonuclease [Caudoviricetes sp.]